MKQFIILVMIGFGFVGCSTKVLLPYDDEPLCKRGTGEGMCGSVSEVYKATARVNYGE
ncbi:hypothetical protein [Sulfuricurvum sp. IAE1]|uniref:hypothetical protein n=1 Tax=Sulfuricurvum sp. IAE1 TaxID=2546102 RepID=UPI0014042D87|nr:hypothetical protein [Sulfuricurvum sp. IAE1]